MVEFYTAENTVPENQAAEEKLSHRHRLAFGLRGSGERGGNRASNLKWLVKRRGCGRACVDADCPETPMPFHSP